MSSMWQSVQIGAVVGLDPRVGLLGGEPRRVGLLNDHPAERWQLFPLEALVVVPKARGKGLPPSRESQRP